MSFFKRILGSSGSQLGDDPYGYNGDESSSKNNFRHFDHSFKGELHTAIGQKVEQVFGACSYSKREITMTCKGGSFDLIEEIGLKSKKQLEVQYVEVKKINLAMIFYLFYELVLMYMFYV